MLTAKDEQALERVWIIKRTGYQEWLVYEERELATALAGGRLVTEYVRADLVLDREETAKRLDYAAWKGFNQSNSEFEKGYKHAMEVAAQTVRASTTKAEG